MFQFFNDQNYRQNKFMRCSINLPQFPIFESKIQIILVENNL